MGDTFPEVVLVNSQDGTSAYQLMAGVFRMVCLNGMIASDRELATIKVPHKGGVVRQVIDGSYTVLEESRRALDQAEAWSDVTLSREEQEIMAEAAHLLRFGESAAATPVRPEQMLTVRRREDEGRDLWTTANVPQENAIRGGLTAWGRDPRGRTGRGPRPAHPAGERRQGRGGALRPPRGPGDKAGTPAQPRWPGPDGPHAARRSRLPGRAPARPRGNGGPAGARRER
mgnify:FL=1